MSGRAFGRRLHAARLAIAHLEAGETVGLAAPTPDRAGAMLGDIARLTPTPLKAELVPWPPAPPMLDFTFDELAGRSHELVGVPWAPPPREPRPPLGWLMRVEVAA